VSFDKSADNYLKSSDHSKGADLEYFAAYFKDKKFKKALDIACAAGHFAKTFNAENIYTCDLSFNMLKTARDKMGFQMPVLCRAEFLPFLSDTFEMAGCRIAMHHFMNPCIFMNDVHRVLCDGGYFVLIDSVVGKEDVWLNKVELVRDDTHRRSFRPEEITAMAEAEDFFLEDYKVFYKKHDFKEWAQRLNPTAEKYEEIIQSFRELPKGIKKELRVEESDEILSYTDKKAVFIFRKK